MDKNKKIMNLLPYKLKTSLNSEDILSFFHKKQKKMKWLFVFGVVLFLIILLVLIILNSSEGINYFLIVVLLFNIVMYHNNYRQFNIPDDEIIMAVEDYAKNKE